MNFLIQLCIFFLIRLVVALVIQILIQIKIMKHRAQQVVVW